MPLPSIVVDRMVVVLTPETQAELGEANTVSFFSVALGLFNLANQARLHKSPFKAKEHRGNSVVLFINHTWYIPHLQTGNFRLKTPAFILFKL